MEPFFSVIIPVYNVENYLEQCIQSVVSQNFCDWEAILIDDGSTDGSGLLCDKLAREDHRIQVIHQENQGLAGARNTGLHRASGKWVLFLDSDDFWLFNFLQKLNSEIQNNPGYIAYIGYYQVADAKGNIQNENPCRNFQPGIGPQGSLAKRFLYYYYMVDVAVWKMVISSIWIKQNQLEFAQRIRYAEDVVWSLQLFCLTSNIYYINLPFIVYRSQREGSLTAFRAPPFYNFESRILAWRKFAKKEITCPSPEDQAFACSFTANKVIGEFQSQIKYYLNDVERQNEVIQLMKENINAARHVRKNDVSLKRYVAARLTILLGPVHMAQLIRFVTTIKSKYSKSVLRNRGEGTAYERKWE